MSEMSGYNADPDSCDPVLSSENSRHVELLRADAEMSRHIVAARRAAGWRAGIHRPYSGFGLSRQHRRQALECGSPLPLSCPKPAAGLWIGHERWPGHRRAVGQLAG